MDWEFLVDWNGIRFPSRKIIASELLGPGHLSCLYCILLFVFYILDIYKDNRRNIPEYIILDLPEHSIRVKLYELIYFQERKNISKNIL